MSFTHIPVLIPILAFKNKVFLKTGENVFLQKQERGCGCLASTAPSLVTSAAVRDRTQHPVFRVHRDHLLQFLLYKTCQVFSKNTG